LANFNFNQVILGGRLTADPELKQTTSGVPVCTFSVAVSRSYQSKTTDGQRETDFINCIAWRQRAELISRYFRKGSSICIVGQIQTRKYTDKDGNNRTATDVIVDNVHFVDSKGEGPSVGQQSNASAYTPDSYAPSFSSQQDAAPKFEEMSNDDDLPF
jgi:single-strand DNA-binding protein